MVTLKVSLVPVSLILMGLSVRFVTFRFFALTVTVATSSEGASPTQVFVETSNMYSVPKS